MELVHGWTLDSNAREAKGRLDQKLRSNRADTLIKRLVRCRSKQIFFLLIHLTMSAVDVRGKRAD
jgi:hypothetical protein